jgi:hypothetical protein
MNKILDVVEDIKQNITDNQYKIIMDSLMEINNTNKFNKSLVPLSQQRRQTIDIRRPQLLNGDSSP